MRQFEIWNTKDGRKLLTRLIDPETETWDRFWGFRRLVREV